MKKALIIGAIIAVIIAVPLLKKATNSDSKEVTVTIAEERVIESSVLASGRLAHEDQVRLTTEVIGKVNKVLVEEGDAVERGQLLLTIEDETFRASVEQRGATVRMQEIAIERQTVQLENLKRQLTRQKKLFEQKLLDEDRYDAAVNAYDIAKIDLKSAKESLSQAKAQLTQADDQLSKTRVQSPFSGIVTSLDIKEGETAIASTTNIAGSSLMTIANPQSIITEVYVDEADIADIQLGQKAKVVAIAYPDVNIDGVVKSIATSAKPVSGRQGLSFLVKLEVTSTEGINLRPGMSCRAEIFTHSSSPVTSVPIQAIVTEEKRSINETHQYLFVVENNIARKVKVATGISDDTYQQITSGLADNVSVINGPDRILRHLKDGDLISIRGNQ
ncbi:efflux RND transporter periplasmic adaptor subunit [Pleionea sp. CnH1-48]|uniref:efflux RND transporter periplasmic adaptor subunit n=1 Tax=Pleionea sp. CnH1-48 TaxID=2954494 RepID=UPI002097B853|nr:efflux RND transporter periplasmic adaptor subunit [Pleionea sp. CnH1-48]MCO7225431.1 efflux RND transporter periplasmic adaptor subunit [Pleionea sp. CnH1-48]